MGLSCTWDADADMKRSRSAKVGAKRFGAGASAASKVLGMALRFLGFDVELEVN